MKRWEKIAFAATLGLSISAFADNPISTYHYLADPSAAADDSTFYILTDVDDYSPQKNYDYDIVGLNAFTSQDMKNWTDHGMVFRSKREFGDYPNNTWASGIAVHKGRIYIVYPNGASGVGMLTATSIDGPYTDPVKETHGVNYIAASYGSSVIGGCDGIAHCFDPGIFIEDDGTGYVIFGGGENGQRPYGNNLDIIKFTENNGKITIDKNSLTRVSAQNSFEAPYIHKKGNKYYLSFNTPPQVIDYGMADKITGPYTFVGTVIPGISSVPDAHNEGGNNHQGFAEFQGKWYAVYHDRRLVTADEHPGSCTQSGQCTNSPNKENHRSVSIDELTWNGDKMNKLTFTREGPKQIKNFDPYRTYKALTSSKQRNVRSRTDWTKGKPVVHVLTPLATKESWIRVSGVDFGNGAQNLRVKAASVADGNKVEIHMGSVSGTLAGSCELAKTSGWNDYADNDCEMSGLTGVVDQLFFVFKGSKDSTMGVLEWEFQGTKREPEPQQPFGGKAWAIPGKIEMENFDEPGYGAGSDSYSDNDTDDHGAESNGGASYREGTGVDIYKKATGYVVGFNQTGEWLEYTVEVAAAGDYTIYAAVASANATSSFKLSIDGEDITEEIAVPQATSGEDNYDEYNKVKANVTLAAGKHILRFTVTGDWMDIDFINFLQGKDAEDTEPIGPLAIGDVRFQNRTSQAYRVYGLSGKMLGTLDLDGTDASSALKAAGYTRGVYMLKQVQGGKRFMVNTAK
ncbi:MAG: carbohydrate-binding protein [Fibrobacter sp.]|uniref:carbohydrate-binding protein n=1 Tax=Fibrobacter sp. TaxID=35828 RepID=UPI001B2F009A|nr:carbohydrate-binding protein [Fibrobacter sp.]MBO7060881.1 carbohydrate-binding protein [Fibrobacter sp.]